MKTKILMLPLAAVLLLGACKGSGSHYEAINNRAADTVASATMDSTASPKLVKTADMRFKVKNVQQTAEKITASTVKNNGMVMHHQMESTVRDSKDFRITGDSVNRVSSFNTTADMTVKIPSEHLEEFMTEVAHMGMYVTMRKMDIEDKSLDFLSAKLKLNSRKELVDQQKKGKVTIKNPVNVLLLKDDMVDGQIGNLEIDDAVKYSIITLSFYQSNTILQEHIANDDPSAYNLPFFSRLAGSFANGWHLFMEAILVIANLWVFILAGISILLLIRFYRRKYSILPDTIKS
ncbi:protein of unknown function [Mucilaginibacter sp. OK268]|uniref:DUF4349 domain-containing protein n=1 Tax=Mucilaginibacter sp. OK268 TaxID=1881048 RepID=UPI00087E699E|nr:DUF4349 domain-containing protein [Mucilaginibacter sp. OK268]SDP01695.1 protein of unknown function [Mucilaginibacter sp. OK268]